MLYWLSAFSDLIGQLNVLRHITFRTGGAMMTAMVFVFLFGPWLIDHLRIRQGKGQPIRGVGPRSHLVTKKGTPTMGGLIILSGVLVSTLLWANLANRYIGIVLAVTLSYGAIGFWRDYRDLSRPSRFSDDMRIAIAASVALAASLLLMRLGPQPTATLFGFQAESAIDLRWSYSLAGAGIIIAVPHIVSLAGRRDGSSAIFPLMIASACLALSAWVGGNALFSDYLQLQFAPGLGELAVLCGAAIGAGIGVRWLDASRGSTFIGDAGSLALGGMCGAIAVATKQEIVLALICSLFAFKPAPAQG